MDINIHAAMLPHDDPEASLAFYRDTLGFEVRNDVEYGGMHWITVGPPNQPDTSIVLYPLAATPSNSTNSSICRVAGPVSFLFDVATFQIAPSGAWTTPP